MATRTRSHVTCVVSGLMTSWNSFYTSLALHTNEPHREQSDLDRTDITVIDAFVTYRYSLCQCCSGKAHFMKTINRRHFNYILLMTNAYSRNSLNRILCQFELTCPPFCLRSSGTSVSSYYISKHGRSIVVRTVGLPAACGIPH